VDELEKSVAESKEYDKNASEKKEEDKQD